MLNKLFSKNKIRPHLSFSQKGNIWRIHFFGDILVCETRDMTSKEVYFCSLNYRTGKVFLKDFQLQEKWWISVDNIDDKFIYFNYFKTPELPEHKGITAVELRTGKVLWENTDLAFWFSHGADVYAVEEKFERKIFYRLDCNSGEELEKYEDDNTEEHLLSLQNISESERYARFINAEILELQTESTDDHITAFLSRYLKDINLLRGLEFIKYGDLLIYNYHKDQGVDLKDLNFRKLSNNLEIYDMKKGAKIFSEILNSQISNYVPDSFFINDGMQFFVKEKKELTVINLNDIS